MASYKTITVISRKEEEILHLNRRVLEDSPDLIAVVGSDYKYYYVNPAYGAVHGLKADDIIGCHIGDFVGKEVFEDIIRTKLEKCMSGQDVRYEEWFDFPKTGVKYMDVRYLPLHDGKGEIDRIVIILRDITFMKKTEESRVYQEKLRTVMELAGTYNHEINNPLCSLRGCLELLKMGEENPERASYIETALENVSRITEVTRKLSEATTLDFTVYPGGEKILTVSNELSSEEAGVDR